MLTQTLDFFLLAFDITGVLGLNLDLFGGIGRNVTCTGQFDQCVSSLGVTMISVS